MVYLDINNMDFTPSWLNDKEKNAEEDVETTEKDKDEGNDVDWNTLAEDNKKED